MSPSPPSRFTCCLVGTAAFTVSCGELLLAAGHELTVVASASASVRAWAAEAGIAAVATVADLAGPDAPGFDYLFSAVNGVVFGPRLLAAPRRAAINYHNGPLPRYAGVHAASWAILNGEREYGVSWHQMVERVDAGALLAQRTFPIPPVATAGEVNDICRRLGLEMLADLVDALASGRARAVPQDLTLRTYCPARRADPSAGLLRWDAGAAAVVRTVRAHDVGPALNTFGSAWLDLGVAAAVVGRAVAVSTRSGAEPGTVVGAGPDRLTVATASSDVMLEDVRHPEGRPLGADTLHAGSRLPVASPDLVARLRTTWETFGPDEDRCARALAATVRQPLPATGPVDARVCLDERLDPTVCLPDGPPGVLEELAVTAAVLLIVALTGCRTVSVRCDRPDDLDGLRRFADRGLPITVPVGPTDGPAAVLGRVRRELAGVRGCDGFARDIALRRHLPRGGVPVAAAAGLPDVHGPPERRYQLRVALGPGHLHLCSSATTAWRALSGPELGAAARHLFTTLRNCAGAP